MNPRLLFLVSFAAILCASCSTSWEPPEAALDEIKGSKCEIRYHFREYTTEGHDEVSAPASRESMLPSWKILHSGDRVASIEGNAEGLSYDFRIYLLKGSAGQFQLQVNVTNGGNPVKGFPVTIKNALPEIKKGIALEIPIGDTLKKQIEKHLLDEGDFFTYADLVIRPVEP